MEAKCPKRGGPFYVGQRMRFTNTKQSIINAATLSFTPLLSSKRSSGPVQYRTGNPRGGFPRARGLPDKDSSFQPAGALPECRYRLTGSHRHPRSHPTTSGLHQPVIPELLSLRIHSHSRIQNISGHSPYRCYIIRAFTVPLFYS